LMVTNLDAGNAENSFHQTRSSDMNIKIQASLQSQQRCN